MPSTRATARKGKYKESVLQDVPESDGSHMESTHEDGASDDIDVYVVNIQKSVTKMRKELQSLRKKNKDLEGKLKKARDVSVTVCSENGPPTRPSHESIKSLKDTIATLKASNKRYRRQIHKLRAKELKAEAEDLLGDGTLPTEDEVDTPQTMRKLLRKFTDLMLVTTLGGWENEICPICLEKLELKKCSSLTCEHVICEECLPKISIGADETVQCPQCRRACPREDLELIHMTESERWDQLLKIAQAWTKLDRRGPEETSEEEAEEAFITEGSGALSELGQTNEDDEDDEDDENDEDDAKIPPPSLRDSLSILQPSTPQAKRQRLEELALERARKRGRI